MSTAVFRAFLLEMAELRGSSSTVGASSDSLLRGAMILDDVAANGVVKQEPDEEEEKILQQIQAHALA